jgi:Leucine-rich repeat (LRR) protein
LTNSNISNITQICEANLINLQILNLRRNCISNIESLLSAKFNNILALDFSLNKLGDDNIEKISHLKFKKLGFLNLFGNDFLDYKLFDLCNNKKFNNLKILYAGSNKFNNNEINTNTFFDLTGVEEIGLTNGVFNNETIHLIHHYRFNNLKKLFLHSNNLSSLSFIDKLELPNIKEIWVNNNSIDDYYPLCKYKSLEFINVRRNCINNIDNLISFIEEFIQLKKIDIRYNNIDFNDNKNENIISEIKKRFVDIDYI